MAVPPTKLYRLATADIALRQFSPKRLNSSTTHISLAFYLNPKVQPTQALGIPLSSLTVQ